MSDPSDKNFYKLIKRNQNPCNSSPDICIRFRGDEVPSVQAKNFTIYFEDLATPKENEDYDEHLPVE